MDNLHIFMLDDNAEFLEVALIALEQEGFPVSKFLDPVPFIVAISSFDGPVIGFVDHDLGRDMVGYDVVREVRTLREDGEFVPLVYLTGRESAENYLSQERNDPFGVPSMFIPKRDLIQIDLLELTNRLFSQFMDQVKTVNRHSALRAIKALMHDADEGQ
jgi:CheY-like chemotaxis protein